MPLKLVAPRKGRSRNWSIRGTYLGVYVDKSCGTDRRSVANEQLKDLRAKIEKREYPEKTLAAGGNVPTFLSAAVSYMQSGRPSRYVAPLIKHFGETPLAEIDQAAIDRCALTLYPNHTPVTRNAYVYGPISAILHAAGIKAVVQRPKGSKGRTITDYLVPEDAFAIIDQAEKIDPEFALLLRFLLYTGARLSEPIELDVRKVHLDQNLAWFRTTKNGKPRTIRLRDDLRDELIAHIGERDSGPLFRFKIGGNLYHKLTRSKLAALGMSCPHRWQKGYKQPPNRLSFVTFHTFRHTWATWMRRYGGADLQGLVATGNWSDVRSAQRYAHVVARDEWQRVDHLPSRGKSVEPNKKSG